MKYLIKIFSLALIAVFAFSNCRHRSLEQRAEWIVKKISSDLSLDDKQKSELNRIKKEILDKERIRCKTNSRRNYRPDSSNTDRRSKS